VKRILTIALVLAFAAAARADTVLPLQFGNKLLIIVTGAPACSNALDFSQACNSQYFFIITPGIP
jgi:hypothetical protein